MLYLFILNFLTLFFFTLKIGKIIVNALLFTGLPKNRESWKNLEFENLG